SAMGFSIGMAMFGAIVFIPLYLQLVYGASPTSSGLRMLPLMAGILAAAIGSGRAISRIGRYKAFPIAATATLSVGTYLPSRLGGGVHLNPEQARHLPAFVHVAFLQAFAHALHGVFLWGMAMAVVPFVLSWLLKEVPLQTTLDHSADVSSAQAPAGGATVVASQFRSTEP